MGNSSSLSTKEVANLVRAELKKRHPTVKFSVRTEYFSGGSAIHVRTPDELGDEFAYKVQKQVDKFAQIRRDGFGEILSGGNLYISVQRKYED